MDKYRFFFLQIALLLVAAVSAPLSQAAAPLAWSPAQVNYTIGNGQGASDPVFVTLQSGDSLDSVSFDVVPELRYFVSVEPGAIPHVEGNTNYIVRLSFAIPPGTPQGSYTGTLHVKSGQRTLPQTLKITVNVDYGKNQVKPVTTALSPQTTPFLSSISPDRSTLVFTQMTAELANLKPGSILILGDSAAAPGGFIGRVASVTINGTNVVVTTTPAGLSDAFTSLDVSLLRTLTQADLRSQIYAAAGISIAQKDALVLTPQSASSNGFSLAFNHVALFDGGAGAKVTLDGSINVNPSFDIRATILGAPSFHFLDNTTVSADLATSAGLSAGISTKRDLAYFNFSPITVWAGPIPIVFVPQITITVGLDGTVSLGLTMSATQTATMTVGFDYANGTATPIKQFSNSFTFQPPTPAASADAKVFAGPQLNLLIYGLAGPFATVRPYVELDIALFDNPQYQLLGGLEAAVGAHLGFLNTTLGDYEFPTLISYHAVLAEGNFPSGAKWTQKATFPPSVPIRGEISFAIGNKGYIAVPCFINLPCATPLWEYDPQSDRWTQLGNHPGLIFDSPHFVLNGNAYVVSGHTVWQYDPASDHWSRKGDIPGADKVAGFGFSLNGLGYIGGGYYNHGAFWQYNPNTDAWAQKNDIPVLQYGLNDPTIRAYEEVTFTIGNKAYVTGTNSYFWEYSPDTDTWVTRSYVDAVYGQAFSIGSKGYIFNTRGALYEYDVTADHWTAVGVFPGQTICYPAGFAIGGSLYVGVGGRFAGNACNLDIVNSWWEFSP